LGRSDPTILQQLQGHDPAQHDAGAEVATLLPEKMRDTNGASEPLISWRGSPRLGGTQER